MEKMRNLLKKLIFSTIIFQNIIRKKEVLVLMKNGAWVEGGCRVNDFYEKVKLFWLFKLGSISDFFYE